MKSDLVTVITGVTYAFFLYLLVAITVERTIEILMAIFKYIEHRLKWYRFWNTRARIIQGRLDRIYAFNEIHPNAPDRVLSRLLWKVMVPTAAGRSDVIAADLIRDKSLRIGSAVLSLVLSLTLVYGLQLDPKPILSNIVQNAKDLAFFSKAFEWDNFRMALLAVAISSGTDPLHHLITSIEKYAVKKDADQKGGAA